MALPWIPLGPVLANAFLCHYETKWLEECPLSFVPVFYARYVDDIFVLLRSKDHIAPLARYMSSKHKNIRFTYEEEINNVLPFLDVTVFRDADGFSFTVHRKDTISGVYSHFDSFMPATYQKGLISTLLYRAHVISSSHKSLHEEVENLKRIFSKNGYPLKLVDKCIFNFFNKIFEKRTPLVTVPKKEFLVVLPFLGSTSWKTKNSLIHTFRELLPFSRLKIVFKSSSRLSSCFSFKDKLPSSLMTGVIYKFTCAECNLCYIGSTKRYWEKRIEEHLHQSALTGNKKSGMQVYAPMQHMRSDTCPSASMSRDEFTIIGREKNPYFLGVKESIIISTKKPKLNGNMTSVPMTLFTP